VKKRIGTISFIICLICLSFDLLAQKTVITTTPSNLNFTVEGPAGEYYPDIYAINGIVIDLETYEQNWTVTCIAESQIKSSGEQIIPAERLLVKLEMPGGDFFPMQGPIVIANGDQPTNGKIRINRLWFKLIILDEDEAGTYHGIIHILLNGEEQAAINIRTLFKQSINLTIVPDFVNFECSGQPGIKDADQPVLITLESNRGLGSIVVEATDLTGPMGMIPNNRLFINCEVQSGPGVNWHGFERMGVNRLCNLGKSRDWSALLSFQLLTVWQDRPGTYQGQVRLILPEAGFQKVIQVTATIHETVTLKLSTRNLQFHTEGLSGESYADQLLKVGIATNYNSWNIQTEATELASDQHVIPNGRIAVYSSEMPDAGFMALNTPRKVAEGTAVSTDEAAILNFKITYLATDVAGQYSGILTFRALGTP